MISKMHFFMCSATIAEVCYGFISHNPGWILIGSIFFALWVPISYFGMVYRPRHPVD